MSECRKWMKITVIENYENKRGTKNSLIYNTSTPISKRIFKVLPVFHQATPFLQRAKKCDFPFTVHDDA